MLFKTIHLDGIKAGTVTLAFRKWQKPTVKTGSLLHTYIGLVKINSIETVDEASITDNDAMKAGFSDKQQLLRSFPANSAGDIYKISVSYHSEDPRIELREQTVVTSEKIADLKQKLQRLDKHSSHGDWTRKVLLAIRDNPHLHAVGIAKLTGFEKEWLKINIRKLKNLGLTISHIVGYEISPLGKALLEKL